jgi:uncharacterized membrane protein
MLSSVSSRLTYIDWMRGLACVLMFQTHCYDSWLGGGARQSRFFMWSQDGGTFPAPLFLFLAGMSLALVTSKLLARRLTPRQIARILILRGAEILGLGLLFRLQEFLIAWGWAPWSDLLKVDILNSIGASLMLMGAVCWLVLALLPQSRNRGSEGQIIRTQLILGTVAVGVALMISLLTPPLWTTWRPDWLAWPIASYIEGVHLGQSQAGLFPIFPWTGFAFMGLGAGFFLRSGWVREREAAAFALAGAGGVGLVYLARWLDARPQQLYATYDYWHTSPDFFLLRVGLLFVILSAVYAWCRWGAGQWGFSPLVQLGQTSLLVYWVHIEFVYGRVSILPKRAVDIPTASVGLLTIFLSMLLLSWFRTRLKGGGPEALAWFRGPVKAG